MFGCISHGAVSISIEWKEGKKSDYKRVDILHDEIIHIHAEN